MLLKAAILKLGRQPYQLCLGSHFCFYHPPLAEETFAARSPESLRSVRLLKEALPTCSYRLVQQFLRLTGIWFGCKQGVEFFYHTVLNRFRTSGKMHHASNCRLELPIDLYTRTTATFKVYSTVSGRRFMSDLREAKARGYLSQTPHYNSVFRYLEAEALTPYLYSLINTSSLPLKSVESDFAVDSSGFSTGQFMRWLDVKYGKEEDRRMWLKVHLICGVKPTS